MAQPTVLALLIYSNNRRMNRFKFKSIFLRWKIKKKQKTTTTTNWFIFFMYIKFFPVRLLCEKRLQVRLILSNKMRNMPWIITMCFNRYPTKRARTSLHFAPFMRITRDPINCTTTVCVNQLAFLLKLFSSFMSYVHGL